jgi:hypothetical protein
MTTTAGHSFYIGPIGSFYDQVNDTGSGYTIDAVSRTDNTLFNIRYTDPHFWSCVNTMSCGSGHLGFQIITKHTNLIRDHSIIIHAQNGFIQLSSF